MKKKRLLSIAFILGLSLISTVNQARVFSLSDQKIASYFKGTTGSSAVLQKPFSEAIDSSATIAETFSSNLAGEIGVVFTAPQIGFLLGVEIIHPKALAAVTGTDITAQDLFNLDSDVSALIPKFGFDIVLAKSELWRLYLNMSGGSGTLSYTNHYQLTAAGQTAFNGLADFSEEIGGVASMMSASFAAEGFLSDATTISLEAGYRQLSFTSLTYKKDVTSISGAHLKGDVVNNLDGTAKTIDFGGVYGGVILRFYLGK